MYLAHSKMSACHQPPISFLRGSNETAKVFYGIKKYQNISLDESYSSHYIGKVLKVT